MIRNIIMASSNALCYLPICSALKYHDKFTAACLIFVSAASVISHLIENHKHGMPGLPIMRVPFTKYHVHITSRMSYIANRFDVYGCGLVISRFICLTYRTYNKVAILFTNINILTLYMFPIIFCKLSTHDKYNAKLRDHYMITHIVWHFGIYYVMYHFLENYIY